MKTKPSRKSLKSKAVDKAEAILAGAMQEFMTCGYAAASMDRIAQAAGVSKPTLYSYFQDKEGLFTALIQQMTLEDPILKAVEGEFMHLPFRDCLQQLAANLLDKFSGEQPLFTLVRLIIGESGRFPNLAQTFVRNIEKPILEKLTRLFAHHLATQSTDPEITARFFMGSLLHYVILQEILHGQEILPLERDRFIHGLVDIIASQKPQ